MVESKLLSVLLWLCYVSSLALSVMEIDDVETKNKATALGYKSVVALGDSIVDTGNNNFIPTVARANFPPYGIDYPNQRPTGRFCDGKLAIDFMAQMFGVKDSVPAYLDPRLTINDLATGVSFASATSGYDTATSQLYRSITPSKQLQNLRDYKRRLQKEIGVANTTMLLKKTLFAVTFGSNDFIITYFATPTRRLEFSVHQYIDFLMDSATSFLHELMEEGASRVIVVGFPPLGCIPLRRSSNTQNFGECIEDENEASMEWNKNLKAMIEMVSKRLPNDQQLIYVNIYDKLLHIIENPEAYGIEVSGRGCCGSGMVEVGTLCGASVSICSDPSKYVFWDAVHPSEKTNRILAAHGLAQILQQLRASS